jgi:hypothetical protein
MYWKFEIDSVEVDEPIGWADVSWSAQRNPEHHGIFFSSKTDAFKWVGDAFTLLSDEYDLSGCDASMLLTISYDCDGSGTYIQFFEGEFDFNTFQRKCGDMCWIEIGLNPSDCVNKFLTRINTDVDIESTTDLDGNAIGPDAFQSVVLNGQTIVLTNSVSSDGTDISQTGAWNLTGARFAYLPVYMTNPVTNEFNDFAISSALDVMYSKDTTGAITWTSIDDFLNIVRNLVIWQRTQDPLNCVDADATINYRVKGTLRFTPQFNGTLETALKFDKFITSEMFTAGATPNINIQIDLIGVSGRVVTAGVTDSVAFDITFSNTPAYTPESDYLLFYFVIFCQKNTASGGADNYTVEILYDDVTNFEMVLNSDCDPTQTEAIQLGSAFTNIALNLNGGDDNGCPSVVVNADCLDNFYLCNGLQIRNSTTPQAPKLFLNWEDFFNGTKKIFNIGWGFYENDTKLAVAGLDFFYGQDVVFDFGSVREVVFTHAEDLTFGKINVGYSNWEAEEYSGLDEMNTLRTFRRKGSKNANELDLVSDIVTAGYTIEITRRKNEAKTGTQDWRYDNNLFLLNTFDDGGTPTIVQDNIESPTNIVSPTTRINYVLTPLRNLMRWFRSICATTPIIASAEIQFQSGNGNFIASGYTENDCPPEAATSIAENESISQTNFLNPDDAVPLWRCVYAEFEAPMSIGNFEAIRDNPYGLIEFSCGQEYSGYLIEINYKPNIGMATAKLLLKKTSETIDHILLESGDSILTETGDLILIE